MREYCIDCKDLVMGTDAAGEKIKDQLKRLAPLLQDKSVSAKDKMRLILLYIIHKGGENDTHAVQLVQNT